MCIPTMLFLQAMILFLERYTTLCVWLLHWSVCIPELVIYVLTFNYYAFFHWFLFDIHGVFYIYFSLLYGLQRGKGQLSGWNVHLMTLLLQVFSDNFLLILLCLCFTIVNISPTLSFVALLMKCFQFCFLFFFHQGFPPPLSTTNLSLKLRCVK